MPSKKGKGNPQETHEPQSALLHFFFRTLGTSVLQADALQSNDRLRYVTAALEESATPCPRHRKKGVIVFDLVLFEASKKSFDEMLERLGQELPVWLKSRESQKRFSKRGTYRVVLTWKREQDTDAPMPPSADTTGPDDETVHLPTEKTVIEAAEQWVNEYNRAVGVIDQRFNQWIASLEGKRFPIETADQQIGAIQHAVRRAGRELVFDDTPVALYLAKPARAKHARIYVTSLGERPQKRLHEGVTLPRLSTRVVR